jgi:two-component system sensor histidine kinase MprB
MRASLRTRLSLLAAGAVAVAVVAIAGLAWLAVRAELHRQLDNQLDVDAATIAVRPAPWRDLPPQPFPEGREPPRGGPHIRHDIGPRWQILGADGQPETVTGILPVTAGARAVAAGTQRRSREQVEIGPVTYRMLTVPASGGGAVQVAVARDPVDRTLAQLGLLLAAGCVGGIAGAALLGRQVARAGLAPVERLTGAVEHVAATQDLQAAIPVTGEDEIARLARSFNAMLAALESSRTAQRALVEDAGHELRTPLTSLRTNIELLIRSDESGRPLSADDRTRLLGDLEVQVVELAQLAGELVELARQDTSPEPVEDVDLADVVGAAVQRARARAPAVTFETDLATVAVPGQPVALERVVLNLLDNAAKWSPSGGTVRVALAAEPHAAVLTVADAGPGIDDADVPRVFERFYRATAARAMPGSGLGLAIVAQTVARHRGTVAVGRSAAGGALLTVRLPFSSDS